MARLRERQMACAAWHPETHQCPHVVGWQYHRKAAKLAMCRERAVLFLKAEGETAIERALSLMGGSPKELYTAADADADAGRRDRGN